MEKLRIIPILLFVFSITLTSCEKCASEEDYDILSASIKGDILNVQVAYGGGCQEVEFDLDISKSFKKSNPPQKNMKVCLEYETNRYRCDMLITESLEFDISQCRHKDYNEVILNLEGWIEPLVYKY